MTPEQVDDLKIGDVSWEVLAEIMIGTRMLPQGARGEGDLGTQEELRKGRDKGIWEACKPRKVTIRIDGGLADSASASRRAMETNQSPDGDWMTQHRIALLEASPEWARLRDKLKTLPVLTWTNEDAEGIRHGLRRRGGLKIEEGNKRMCISWDKMLTGWRV